MEPHGDPRHHTPGPSGAKGSPKRGRPVGSVAHAPDVEQAILDAISLERTQPGERGHLHAESVARQALGQDHHLLLGTRAIKGRY